MKRNVKSNRFGVAALAICVVLTLVGGLGAIWISKKVNPSGSPGPAKRVNIPSGASSASIATLLERSNIITDAGIFRWYLRIKGGVEFQAGTYQLSARSSMGDVVEALSKPPLLVTKRLTVPEGFTLDELATRAQRVPWLESERVHRVLDSGSISSPWAPKGVTSLEGLLFPDTYQIDETEDEAELLKRMASAFDAVARELGYDRANELVGHSSYEAIVVASLVEAEAKVDVDRAKIARVIYNRLDKRMTLGIDATVYYALGRKGGSLTRSDLEVDSPYNTRKVAGLPPTPIALPGRASLEAALNPEPGPWLYYVLANETGEHAFSASYSQFLADKANAARKGLL